MVTLTLKFFNAKSNRWHNGVGMMMTRPTTPSSWLLEMLKYRRLAAIVESNDQYVDLLFLHAKHVGQFVEQSHLAVDFLVMLDKVLLTRA
jgi:hypothetical protein